MNRSAATTQELDRPSPRRDADTALAGRLVRQDPAALNDAYTLYGHRVYRVAYGLLRREELAQDITQDVFLRLWNRPERFDAERGSLSSFLQLDAHGRSIDLIRSEEARSKREVTSERQSSNHQAGPEEEAMKMIASQRVRNALATIKETERAPIAMAFYLGYSYRKTAAVLGVPEGTVKSRIRSGLAKLRDTLGTEIDGLA